MKQNLMTPSVGDYGADVVSFSLPEQAPVCERPSTIASLLELRAPAELLAGVARLPSLLRSPKGEPRPIMLAPGFLTDEYAMAPLGKFLKFLGYDVYHWGLGRNMGDVELLIEGMANTIRVYRDAYQLQPFTLIGWSLGGVISREVARQFPGDVSEVITLGTPIIGGPKYTSVADKFKRMKGIDFDQLEQEIHSRNLEGITQPVTSIYSKTDGVVSWQSSIDIYNEHALNIEVNGSHLALGVNTRVWRNIAKILASNNHIQQ